jgi:uncharacterized protein (DUF433 family)
MKLSYMFARYRGYPAEAEAMNHRNRGRIISNPDILSGEPVFDGTRIPLAHIASLIANGVDLAEIREDYPSLNEPDLQFAAIRAKAKPSPERPRKELEIRRRGPLEGEIGGFGKGR